jgi:cardiolipin synthase
MTPYFNPPSFLLKALIEAAGKGVDVRLVVPKRTDPAWFSYLSRIYFSPLVKRNIRVYEYTPGILHSKITLIDSEGIIGSGNLNYRSFYRDLELNLIIQDSKGVQDLRNEFIKDMTMSREINKTDHLSAWEKLFGSFLTIFKTSF